MTDRIAEAKAQIAQTREALALTTSQLAAKADVKGRTVAKVKERRAPLGAAAGLAALVLTIVVWRRHR